MKNKFKILAYTFLGALLITACDDNEEKLYIVDSETQAPAILSPETGTAIELSIENETAQATTLVWDAAVYNVQTAIDYTVEFAVADTDFATTVTAAETSNTYASWTVTELNGYATTLGLTPFSAENIEVRVKSAVGTDGEAEAYSDPITLSITSYTSSLPKIGVPGNHQGWDPATAPELAASAYGETDYEGYVWLDGEYKFIAPDATGAYAWGNTDWGDDGTFTGVLVADDESNCEATVAGHYYLSVDTEALTYTATMYDWGLIGDATPGGWDADTDMTYDSTTGLWSVTLELTAGEIKFRANDGWDWNYGDTGVDGILDNGGDNIAVAAAGTYTVVLDLTTPREYTYTITMN